MEPMTADPWAPARPAIETLMLDSCTVTEAESSGPGVLDEVTLTMTYPAPTVVYSGKCLVDQSAGTGAVIKDDTATDRAELSIPWADRAALEVGHLVTIDSAPDVVFVVDRVPAVSGALTGRAYLSRRTVGPTPHGPTA